MTYILCFVSVDPNKRLALFKKLEEANKLRDVKPPARKQPANRVEYFAGKCHRAPKRLPGSERSWIAVSRVFVVLRIDWSVIMAKSSWDGADWIWLYNRTSYCFPTRLSLTLWVAMVPPPLPSPWINFGVSWWPLHTVCSWYSKIDSGRVGGGDWYRPYTFDHGCSSPKWDVVVRSQISLISGKSASMLWTAGGMLTRHFSFSSRGHVASFRCIHANQREGGQGGNDVQVLT